MVRPGAEHDGDGGLSTDDDPSLLVQLLNDEALRNLTSRGMPWLDSKTEEHGGFASGGSGGDGDGDDQWDPLEAAYATRRRTSRRRAGGTGPCRP